MNLNEPGSDRCRNSRTRNCTNPMRTETYAEELAQHQAAETLYELLSCINQEHNKVIAWFFQPTETMFNAWVVTGTAVHVVEYTPTDDHLWITIPRTRISRVVANQQPGSYEVLIEIDADTQQTETTGEALEVDAADVGQTTPNADAARQRYTWTRATSTARKAGYTRRADNAADIAALKRFWETTITH